ncbi:hypothetical protein [Sphingomonas hengshuiensis]|nr:hypothetical protein [Sphingomonas hengshuiensis]
MPFPLATEYHRTVNSVISGKYGGRSRYCRRLPDICPFSILGYGGTI